MVLCESHHQDGLRSVSARLSLRGGWYANCGFGDVWEVEGFLEAKGLLEVKDLLGWQRTPQTKNERISLRARLRKVWGVGNCYSSFPSSS